ncbi:ExbD/TolR family protein [Planctellipticum variicoloris]|jgi:biopolymer transport protein ExbD|uniref:ExbD/TolR family protein n=1 Tax=Planctellipticum variicoloris TaxID=3064265 RepID=UPI003013F3F0|nr:biopolymer transporter ExbD [Planctomycetaceae bacterium SH412]
MSAHNSEGAEPNLTPILDMVFQLVTFFMLVINFKGATLDLSLKLPVLGSARPLDSRSGKDPIVLNIDSEGVVKIFGAPVDLDQYLTREARLLRSLQGPAAAAGALDTPVVIRADRSVTFHLLNHVITTCQKHGFYHYQLSAMTREEQR